MDSVVKRGKPTVTDHLKVTDLLLSYVERILHSDHKVISKTNSIWYELSVKLNHQKSPQALYTFVTCNKTGIREKLQNELLKINPEYNFKHNNGDNAERLSESYEFNDISLDASSLNSSIATVDDNTHFSLYMPKTDFNNLLTVKRFKLKTNKYRECIRLKNGEWENIINLKIWKQLKIKCGYNFKYHYINQNKESGYMEGECKCGSKITGELKADDSDIVTINCIATKGNGSCGKVYIRASHRTNAANELLKKTAYMYRAERADDLMREGDVEPAILPTACVLRTAKNQHKATFYLDRDPIRAVHMMQLHSMQNTIHRIGLSPFYVQYSSNHQNTLYKKFSDNYCPSIAIDATGEIIKSVIKPDKSKTKVIFLYQAVIRVEELGLSIPVAQFISENHSTNIISFWLREWIESAGLPPPKEVTCDKSLALLGAVVRAFTRFNTLQDYCNACFHEVPSCYIRMDVAHVMALFAKRLKESREQVRKFFLTVVGRIIMATSVYEAEKIITAVFAVAASEFNETCEEEKEYLKSILCFQNEELEAIIDSSTSFICDRQSEERNVTFLEEPQSAKHNHWQIWGQDLGDKVTEELESRKLHANDLSLNAYYSPNLVSFLASQLKFLPLWSCICRNKFGYGRIPASSASVEGEFSNLKSRVLKEEQLPLRPDEFLPIHIRYISGITKIADAALQDREEITTASSSNDANKEVVNVAMIKCPLCKEAITIGRNIGGAHTCMVCGKIVHILAECSVPCSEDEEEGFGQKRVCLSCHNHDNIDNILTSKNVENWRGLATNSQKPKKSGKYLQPLYKENEFTLRMKTSKIQILKNGGSISLKAQKTKTRSVSLANTCAFDSLFQCFLVAAVDRSSFRKYLHPNKKEFFQLILKVQQEGINANTYRERYNVLSKLFALSSPVLGCSVLKCEVAIAHLCRKLLTDVPSFEEKTTCSNCSESKILPLAIGAINLSKLLSEDYEKIIYEEINLADSPCYNCDGYLSRKLTVTGPYLLLEIVPNSEDITCDIPVQPKVRLAKIPKLIKLPCMENAYSLLGIINFKGDHCISTRLSVTSAIGHYSAFCFRNNNWFVYDDTKDSESKIKETEFVSPQLIIYFKV